MDITPYVAPIVTAIVTGGATYAAIVTRLTKVETKVEHMESAQIDAHALSAQIAALGQKVDDLREDVARHNSIVERTYKVENDMATMWKRHDELRQQVHELEKRQS